MALVRYVRARNMDEATALMLGSKPVQSFVTTDDLATILMRHKRKRVSLVIPTKKGGQEIRCGYPDSIISLKGKPHVRLSRWSPVFYRKRKIELGRPGRRFFDGWRFIMKILSIHDGRRPKRITRGKTYREYDMALVDECKIKKSRLVLRS